MANKITQLVNESGDNLYPLAGGMAADSINTQMLKDGAVTSDKIDSVTVDLMPYAASIVTAGNAIAITKGGITSITLNITAQSASTGDKVIFSNLPASIMPQAAPGMFAATTSTGSALSIRARTSDSSIICTFSSTSAISIRATATYISQ